MLVRNIAFVDLIINRFLLARLNLSKVPKKRQDAPKDVRNGKNYILYSFITSS